MGTTSQQFEDDENFDDPEDPSPEDVVDGDEPTTEECPYCYRPVIDDNEVCPYCGQYIIRDEATSPSRRPWWIVAGVVGAGLALAVWVLR